MGIHAWSGQVQEPEGQGPDWGHVSVCSPPWELINHYRQVRGTGKPLLPKSSPHGCSGNILPFTKHSSWVKLHPAFLQSKAPSGFLYLSEEFLLEAGQQAQEVVTWDPDPEQEEKRPSLCPTCRQHPAFLGLLSFSSPLTSRPSLGNRKRPIHQIRKPSLREVEVFAQSHTGS